MEQNRRVKLENAIRCLDIYKQRCVNTNPLCYMYSMIMNKILTENMTMELNEDDANYIDDYTLDSFSDEESVDYIIQGMVSSSNITIESIEEDIISYFYN